MNRTSSLVRLAAIAVAVLFAGPLAVPHGSAAAQDCACDQPADPDFQAGVLWRGTGPDLTTDEIVTLGAPERFTGEGIFEGVVSPFNPAYGTDEIFSMGRGGFLVVEFDEAVEDDPRNPFGIDLIVFGNAGFIDAAYPAGIVGGLGAFGGFVIPPFMGLFVKISGQPGFAYGFAVFLILAVLALLLLVVLNRFTLAETKVAVASA